MQNNPKANISPLNISQALELSPPQHPVVSFVGAGGKTTLMFRLAQELKSAYRRILATTTTHIRLPTAEQCDQRFLFHTLPSSWKNWKGITVVGSRQSSIDNKLKGLSFDQLAEIRTQFEAILIEADGAAQKSIKAPADHEPEQEHTYHEYISGSGQFDAQKRSFCHCDYYESEGIHAEKCGENDCKAGR